MSSPHRKVELLRRLARMREVERHAAALRVAEAAGLHGKLLTLHERSGQIADAYADHSETRDAADLAGRLRFVAGLQAILRETDGDRRKAEASNTEAVTQLKLAERRRDVTGERLAAERQAAQNVLLARQNPILARKLKG
jgi:alkanesulfonate monooxygenase SsuD/methylene tetrahydromethanopterin reductase-like flavin-dependent oxidoreductase (luciferase family)